MKKKVTVTLDYTLGIQNDKWSLLSQSDCGVDRYEFVRTNLEARSVNVIVLIPNHTLPILSSQWLHGAAAEALADRRFGYTYDLTETFVE